MATNVTGRLGRLEQMRADGFAGRDEQTVADVAAETGLAPAEVRAELAAIVDQTRRSGPRTAGEVIDGLAAELGLPEADLWADLGRIASPSTEAVR